MKNKLGPILIVIVIVLAVVGSTYSWFYWQANEANRIGVNFSTSGASDECITYSTTNSGNPILIPTSVKEKGYVTTVQVAQTCNTNFYVDLNLKLNKLPANLKHQSFKYTLTDGSTVIGEGDFVSSNQGSTIKVATRQLLTTTPKTYTLYLWIDGNQSNPNTMQNQEYQFDLVATITDEVK